MIDYHGNPTLSDDILDLSTSPSGVTDINSFLELSLDLEKK